eukprot:COSAG01_NODE_5119_length_4472_cov_20.726961_4_plen_195_part_00
MQNPWNVTPVQAQHRAQLLSAFDKLRGVQQRSCVISRDGQFDCDGAVAACNMLLPRDTLTAITVGSAAPSCSKRIADGKGVTWQKREVQILEPFRQSIVKLNIQQVIAKADPAHQLFVNSIKNLSKRERKVLSNQFADLGDLLTRGKDTLKGLKFSKNAQANVRKALQSRSVTLAASIDDVIEHVKQTRPQSWR